MITQVSISEMEFHSERGLESYITQYDPERSLESYITQYDELLKNTNMSSCSEEFGSEMIYRWKHTRIDICSGGIDSGKITCFRRNEYEMPRMLCQIMNSAMKMYTPYITHDSYNLSIGSNVKIMNSILEINCNPTIYEWIPKQEWEQRIGEFSRDHFLKNIKFLPNKPLVNCEHYINHTVFWIDRWDAKNVYHFMEDLITTFESLLVLNENPENIEIVIYDGLIANNVLITAWSELFGKGLRIIRDNPYPKSVCFRKSILNMYAMRSHLTQNRNHARPMQCKSPILQGFRDWIWEKLKIKQELEPKDSLKIVFLSRTKPSSRTIENEDEIFDAIKLTFNRWELFVFRPELHISFKDQVKIVFHADILIGVHGAGLTYSMFMKPESHLVEIFMDDRTSVNMHYRSIAKWTNLNYHKIEGKGTYKKIVPVKHIMEVVNYIVSKVEASNNLTEYKYM